MGWARGPRGPGSGGRGGGHGLRDRGFAEWRSGHWRRSCCNPLRLRIRQTCRGMGRWHRLRSRSASPVYICCQRGV